MRTWSVLSKEASRFEQATKSTSECLFQTISVCHLRKHRLSNKAAFMISRTLWHYEIQVFKWSFQMFVSGWKNAKFKLKVQHFSINKIMIVTSCFMSSNRDCQNVLNVTQDQASQSDSFRQFEGGVKLGIGSFNLVGFQRGVLPWAPNWRSLTAVNVQSQKSWLNWLPGVFYVLSKLLVTCCVKTLTKFTVSAYFTGLKITGLWVSLWGWGGYPHINTPFCLFFSDKIKSMSSAYWQIRAINRLTQIQCKIHIDWLKSSWFNCLFHYDLTVFSLSLFQMLSLLPQRILRLLEFIGFSGNRVSTSTFKVILQWYCICSTL